MFDTFNGLPLHPLVVHFAVVLLVLAVVGTLVIAVAPALRMRYGPLVALVAVAGTASVPVATQSGEALERRVGDPGRHAELGDQLLWYALPLAVLCVALVALDVGTRRRGAVRRRTALRVVSVLSVLAALAAGWQVYRVGDSGAEAVWGTATSASTFLSR